MTVHSPGARVSHDWRFVLDDKLLELRTSSASREHGKAAEVHEDVGFVSRDTDKGAFVFRQFLSEGFVNTYDVSTGSRENPVFVFGYRESESAGGMRARLRLTFLGHDEYEMVLELASPGKDFAACQTMRMQRVDRGEAP